MKPLPVPFTPMTYRLNLLPPNLRNLGLPYNLPGLVDRHIWPVRLDRFLDSQP